MDFEHILPAISKDKSKIFLKGDYAFSHRGEIETNGNFIPQTFVGYMNFDGNGKVEGKGVVNRNGGTPFEAVDNKGTYTVALSNTGTITGTIKTTGKMAINPKQEITIEYSFVMADNLREIKYAAQTVTVTDTTTNIATTKRVLVWGTMTKVWS